MAETTDDPPRAGHVQHGLRPGADVVGEQSHEPRHHPRRAQSETVKDYTLLARKAGFNELITLASLQGNFQRLRRHDFAPVEVDAVRLHITATNGDDRATIFEVRCYG